MNAQEIKQIEKYIVIMTVDGLEAIIDSSHGIV